eukprot:TRINITY_DN3468_c0_g1_i1.p1 TRINITY_DN3468_c0_g1~~TRINITY_DN3468_c0_g1_i1.p1  ORF type:complete len:961 (+),score=382.36 TRINITY_DN3468_c0_g1_i1:222-3104(+)
MNVNPSPGLRIKVAVHKFEAENPKFAAPVHALFNVNKGAPSRLGIGTAYTFPIQRSDKSFQLTVKDTATNRSLGSLTMSLTEIFRFNSQNKMHWVTLFEDPEDDIYDGNYTENDEEVPRVLVSYEILNLTEDKKTTNEGCGSVPYAGWQDKIKNLCKLDGLDSILEMDEELKGGENEGAPEPKKTSETRTKKRAHRHATSSTNKVGNDTSRDATHNPPKDQTQTALSLENEKLKRSLEKLIEQNTSQRNEISEVEGRMESLSAKYQTAIKTYDEEIEATVKEKYELQKKLSTLEHFLRHAENEVKEYKSRLNEVQEQSKAEMVSMEAKARREIAEYAQQVKDLKGDLITDVEYRKIGPKEFLQRLIEIEDVYSKRADEMKDKMLKSEGKIGDMLKELQERRVTEAEIQEKSRLIQQENENLKSTNESLQADLKVARATICQLETRLLEAEKHSVPKVDITSIIDRAKALLESIETTAVDQPNIAKEDEGLKTQLELLRTELSAKNEILAASSNSLKERLGKREEEVSRLEEKLSGMQEKLFGKLHVEEQLEEKAKIINSFELLINEYKNSTDSLKLKNQELDIKLRKANEEINILKERNKQPRADVVREENVTGETNLTIDGVKAVNDEDDKYKKEISELRGELKRKQDELEGEQKKWAERLEDIAEQTKEIESWRLKSRAKEEKLQELSTKLMQQNRIARELEAQLYQTQQELDKSNENSIKIIEEYELMKGELMQREKEIESLTRLLANCKQSLDDDVKSPQIIYNSSDNSDRVDQMFALYINAVRCPVQLKRVGDGQYIFGTKKIFAKIQNDKLVIRVGGGYMMIEDFLTTYTAPELNKMKRAIGNDCEDPANTSGYKLRKGTDEEFESDQSQSNSFTKCKKSDTRVGLKTASRPITDKTKTANSRSPTSGLADCSSKAKILTEQNIGNGKLSTDRLAMKKKLLMGEEIENDNNTMA